MTVDVDGNLNRVAGRDFVEINIAGTEAEPLTDRQRKRLNQLVNQISQEARIDPRELWRSMHDSIGTTTISEVRRDQYQQAIAVLESIQARAEDEAEAQALIERIVEAAGAKGLRADMAGYCLTEFGTEQFNRMTQLQLAQVLKWVHAEPSKNVMLESPKKAPALPESMVGLKALVIEQPWHCAVVFLVGVLFGAVLY